MLEFPAGRDHLLFFVGLFSRPDMARSQHNTDVKFKVEAISVSQVVVRVESKAFSDNSNNGKDGSSGRWLHLILR